MACELMTQYGMASGVYKYGLGNVSPSEPNYKVYSLLIIMLSVAV
jgi:hypothetical protein